MRHLEKYVGIRGSALQLIKSYFSKRTKRVMIDGILSDFASLICGVPQGSVLEPMEFCLYLLPLGAIDIIILARCATLTIHNSTLKRSPLLQTDMSGLSGVGDS